MVLAIDPSFTGTGVAITDDKGTPILTKKISKKGVCYDKITHNHDACQAICDNIIHLIEELSLSKVHVICEYPAFATRSGSYLAILNGFIASNLRQNGRIASITWVGPKACDSFTGNKMHSKSYLVDWCRAKELIYKRTSHDECTALIFAQLLVAIWNKTYKNLAFTWYNPKFHEDY